MFVNSWITSEIFKMLIPLIFPSLGDLLEHSTSNSRAWCCSEERPHPKILHRRNWIYVVRKMTKMIILLQVLVLKSYGMLFDKWLVQELEDVDQIYTIFIQVYFHGDQIIWNISNIVPCWLVICTLTIVDEVIIDALIVALY